MIIRTGQLRHLQAPARRSLAYSLVQQLATMDRLTREAIDERLKALERVSNTIYGCIDDLMRMRSALPELHQPSVWNAETSARPHATASASTRQEEKRPEGSGLSHAEDGGTDSP